MIRYPTDIDKKIKVLEALSNLEHNDAFNVFIDWLTNESLHISKENNDILSETVLRWSQGHFQLLSDLLKKVSTSRDTLEKLRNQAPPKGRA